MVGRRVDPSTGTLYHLKYDPPPEDLIPHLVQREDDTVAAMRTRLRVYHENLRSVAGIYGKISCKVDGVGDKLTVFKGQRCRGIALKLYLCCAEFTRSNDSGFMRAYQNALSSIQYSSIALILGVQGHIQKQLDREPDLY